ncbi:NAD(P)-dependent alcohol dehydrogenase [Chryseobacterium chendengshani]|uniref:NAD(P)-dependent alcohol dehydrogenase n=1 Tax=unclassified Chryseobacterium TaxID=2593645 RepID=UPI001C63DB26|nr:MULTISPECIES: NAD(P)-dependent alcohol dehydrogenase [unclassified Chryseobacterium]MBW7675862.1 NAD(P)-dependent alcohol dehydrogenase [Chryseobacterium sp. LJ756]MBW8524534.1 NAD(P)-dependent alcohol dehydrogenase [Chryseobacterium sp. LJ668]QYK15225.1 NAD(P)-dependent alcohol dehydrogenase [Chryseobacterium sp. LJ668]
MNTYSVKAYGTESKEADLKQMNIERRQTTTKDVEIEILFCGVCHSDLHTARNDWGGTKYPAVPGHEIVGRITKVGSEVSQFKVGDLAGVGCIVDSCGTCESCKQNLEQYCLTGFTGTYNGTDEHLGGHTFGGYSEKVVVDADHVLRIPENLDLAAVAPLLCAGITTWSPLKHWNVGPNSKVAVVGLGGLGHMAIKLAKGLGAEVTLFSRTPGKSDDAKQLGADHVVISTDEEQMKSVKGKFDVIIDTVPYDHDVNPYISTLNINGTHVLVGYLGGLENILNTVPMILGRKSVAGSVIGGIAETQEMLDFCGEHNIVSEIEMIKMQEINEAYERMLKSDVRYRFVIDMKSL